MSEIIKNRYEFVLLFDVENGNPNGDPDSGNMPRIDPETGYGIVTDVCLKRKIRNYVQIKKEDCLKFKIYVKEGVPLDQNRKWAYEQTEIAVPKNTKDAPPKEEYEKITKFMCDNFYDIRTFGAVMTLQYNCGQVRGPVQLNFARSVEPVFANEITITSCTYANEGETSSKMGRKHIVPYGLYKAEGYVSAYLAQKTGFTEADLELLWEALINMFDHDHSAARGKICSRKLIVFKHESMLGNIQAHKLFDLISIKKKDSNKIARDFSDFEIEINNDKINGVEIIEKL